MRNTAKRKPLKRAVIHLRCAKNPRKAACGRTGFAYGCDRPWTPHFVWMTRKQYHYYRWCRTCLAIARRRHPESWKPMPRWARHDPMLRAAFEVKRYGNTEAGERHD